MTHGDDEGLCVPPKIAPYQVIIVPILKDPSKNEAVMAYAKSLKEKIASIYSSFEYAENMSAKSVLEDLIAKRNEARLNKNWALSDKIRDELKAVGIILKDTKETTTWEVE